MHDFYQAVMQVEKETNIQKKFLQINLNRLNHLFECFLTNF